MVKWEEAVGSTGSNGIHAIGKELAAGRPKKVEGNWEHTFILRIWNKASGKSAAESWGDTAEEAGRENLKPDPNQFDRRRP